MSQASTDRHQIAPRAIEDYLLRHPHVNEAVVLEPESTPGGNQLIAYVAADLTKLKALQEKHARRPDSVIVDRWNKLYELNYSAGPAAPSFVGWNSSYTRQPIPLDQMQEWLAMTSDRIRALQPRCLLEIGCGVGLLLQHLAPQCPVYVATDFSASALAQVGSWIRQRDDLKHVELLHRSAIEHDDMAEGRFDTVVLNSVVQYFPDINYLIVVLQQALRLLSPGGSIFIGDIRNSRLLPVFHSAVQLSRAADSVSARQLRRRIARAITQETELTIDPQFFNAFARHQSAISAVDVQLRRGRAHNELTRYRYDAVLRTAAGIRHDTVRETVRWRSTCNLDAEMAACSNQRHEPAFGFSSIPNLRLAWDATAAKLIESGDEQLTARAMRDQLNGIQFDGVEPEMFWHWSATRGYAVSVGWDRRDPECFEAYVSGPRTGCANRLSSSTPDAPKPWGSYANDPLENAVGQQLILQLRQYLRERLPEWSIPSGWTVLKELPRTPDGKVDRRRL